MCLLVVAKTCRPDPAILELGNEQNPHGIGIAYRKSGKVHFQKNINMWELEEILETEDPPYIVHFRLASAGGFHPGLCHPFPVSTEYNLQLEGTADAIIAHNGHINGWQEHTFKTFAYSGAKCPPGPWSDTRLMSYLVAKNGVDILNLLPEKVAYMNANQIRIFYEWAFVKHQQKKGEILLSYDVFQRKEDDQSEALKAWLLANRNKSGSPEERVTEMQKQLLNELNKDERALANEIDEGTIAEIRNGGPDAELFSRTLETTIRIIDEGDEEDYVE